MRFITIEFSREKRAPFFRFTEETGPFHESLLINLIGNSSKINDDSSQFNYKKLKEKEKKLYSNLKCKTGTSHI